MAALKDSQLRVFDFADDGELEGQVVPPELDGDFDRLRTPVLGRGGALSVSASNGGGRDAIVRVFPNHPPMFGMLAVNRLVANNAPADQLIGDPIAAADPGGDSVTYALTGTDADHFDLISESGQLQIAAALDVAAGDTYSVTVTATDSYSTSSGLIVVIIAVDPSLVTPGAPTDPMTATASATSLEISWLPPADPSRLGIAFYDLRYIKSAAPDKADGN